MTLPNATTLDDLERLANAALARWALPRGATARLINISENATYLVTAPGGHRSVLRVHRENYHSPRAISAELAWLDALRADAVLDTPRYYTGRDGNPIQRIERPGLPPRDLVLFHFIDGTAPDDTGDMTQGFQTLGAMAAKCHRHAIHWQKPPGFKRFTWDTDAVFGVAPIWGDWRDGPDVTPSVRATLTKVQATICTRLTAYGQAPERFNLIHADMRLANLLVSGDTIRLIDFDDCGQGWLMYDFAAAISFMEDDARVPACKAAWLQGYQSIRPLDAADLAEIDTFILMRRMALLAWIGSHIDAPEPQAYAPGFAETTARLGKRWLDGL